MAGDNLNERNEAAQDEMLASILQKLSLPGASSPSAASPPSVDTQLSSSAANPMGDIISSLLSNPEMLTKLPALLSSIKPIMEMLGGLGGGGAASASATAQALPTPQAAPSAVKPSDKGSDSRTALLCAMKPYLSADRQNAIDYIIKLGRLGDILKTL